MKQELIQKKLRNKFLKQGVKMISPETVFFSNKTKIGKNVLIEPYVIFIGNVVLKNNITPGDMIKVSTRRGEIKIKVQEDRAIPEGVIFIPFCYNEAAANLLTNPALDPFGKIPEFKYCAAKIQTL